MIGPKDTRVGQTTSGEEVQVQMGHSDLEVPLLTNRPVDSRNVKFAETVFLGTQYIVALGAMACAGTLYAFGAYAEPIKVSLGWSQKQIELVGNIGDAGLYVFGPVFGRVVDLLGPRLCNTIAAIFLALGYSLMYVLIASKTDSAVLLGVVMALAGAGSGGFYISVLTGQMHMFDHKHRGVVVGILVSFYGLSAFFFTTFYKWRFNDQPVQEFLLFMAGVTGGVALLAAAFSPSYDFINKINQEDQQICHLVDAKSGWLLEDPSIEEALLASDAQEDLQQPTGRAAAASNVHAHYANDEDFRSFSALGWVVKLVKDGRFMICFWVLWFIGGSGLVYINNIGSIVKSFNDQGKHSVKKEDIVMLFSIMNCIGRTCAGLGSDYAPMRKGWWMVLECGLMAGMYGMLTFASDHLLPIYIATVGIGAAYGGLWAIIPLMVTEMFGLESFGSTWGYLLFGPGAGGVCFNLLTGWLYDRAASSGDESASECFGEKCFQPMFSFLFGVCTVAFILSFFIVPYTHRGSVTIAH